MGWLKQLFLVAEIGILALVALTICASYFQPISVPCFRRVQATPSEWRTARSETWELELQDLGFRKIGDFVWEATKDICFFLHAYSSPEGWHLGLVQGSFVNVFGRTHTVNRTAKLLFMTQLSPVGLLTTNNGKTQDPLPSMLDRVDLRLPWKRGAADLYRLHCLLFDTASDCGLSAIPIPPGGFGELLAAQVRQYYDHLVDKRLLVRATDMSYRPTWKGALVCGALLWWNLTYAFLLHCYRPRDQKLCDRARRRFRRVHSVR